MTQTYIHPALADNADGEYQVRTGEKKFKIRKAAKHTVDFELRRDQEIPLIYDEDGIFNAEETKEEIFTRVFSASNAEFVSCEDVTIQYYGTAESGAVGNLGKDWVALDGEKVNLLTYPVIPAGKQKIRISWGGSRDYAPGSVTVSVTVTDNRINSKVVLKSETSFTYNKDVEAVKQAVLDNVIDWENSELPERDTLSVDDFTFSYNARLSLLDGLSSELGDSFADKFLNGEGIRDDVPFEGKSYELGGKVLGSFPQIGAGVQKIKVTFKGNSEYRASEEAEGSVTINKANVKVSVNSASRYVSEAVKGRELVSTDPEDHFNLYIIYAGITSNVTTGVYLELPEQYTSNSTVIKIVDKALESLNQPTLTEMLQNGITVGELRKLLNTSEVIDVLEKIGVDTGALGQVIKVINKLPSIADNLRINIGAPNHAGIYSVTAVTDNKNYNTGVGAGALVLKADKAKLVWNQSIGKKISAADAAAADFGAHLEIGGERVDDQSSVSVLYSGFTSKWRAYSSTTTPPTEPGRYTMTVVVLGGNYLASPINRSFQITK